METPKEMEADARKFVAADPEKCVGCGICEVVCALEKEKLFDPHLSRIKILRSYQLINMAIACRFCEDAPCVVACPAGALTQSEKGVILVNEKKCDMCGWCIKACPHGAIAIDLNKKVVVMCDLCDGEPKCVEWCPEEALDLVTKETLDRKIRIATVSKIMPEAWR